MRALIVAVWSGTMAMQPPQQPPRDTRPPTSATATASISGTVVSDEAQPRKLRRVRVTINGAAMDTGGRTVISDDEGRYQISGLPPGQYGLTAVKDGYIAARYGSGRPPKLGNPRTIPATGLSLRSGDSVTADFRLPRGAVITGVVTDLEGRPEEGAIVTAASYQFVANADERRLFVASPLLRTDDHGVYRIYGLRAGEYVVAAQRGTSGAETNLKPSSSDARSVAQAPVYFPSATDVTAATWIKLASGDERTGVDIQMRYVPTATLAGIVAMPPGAAFGRVALARATSQTGAIESVYGTSTQSDGTFSLPNVTPGHYTLYAIAQGLSGGGGSSNTSLAAGSVGIDVDGDDVTSVAMPMSPAFSISGTLVFDGASPPDVRLGRTTLPIAPIGAYGIPTASFQPLDQSHFTIAGLIPGTYRVTGATVPGVRAPIGEWWLKSIAIAGREALDGPIEIRQSSDEAVVTVGDQASAVSGTVRDAQGSPLPDVYVVIFSANRASWFFNSRRVAGVRTDAQGRYTIRNLPPGEYRAAVALDLEAGEWFDPDALQSLQASAIPLTISGVETKTLALTIR